MMRWLRSHQLLPSNDKHFKNEFHDEADVGAQVKDKQNSEPPGLTYSIRWLAFATLALLAVSHLLVERQCLVARTKSEVATEPIVRQYQVATKHTSLGIYKKASNHKLKGWMSDVQPHEIVEFIGDGTDEFHHVLEPALGWAERISPHTGKDRFRPLGFPPISRICPLMYLGTPFRNETNRYTRAPTALVIAQQLWNATQVFTLILLLSVLYDFAQPNEEVELKVKKWRFIAACVMSVCYLCLLPFSSYVISPGAHISAVLTLGLTLLAILTPVNKIRLSIGEEDVEPAGDTDCKSWFLIREETLCALCYLGSTSYNAAAGVNPWPHPRTMMDKLGKFLGWPNDDDNATPSELFDMYGLFSTARLPTFVPRAQGSHIRAHIFLLVWTILPFLYVCNFLVMIAMSKKSPGKWIQRFFCMFGIMHFLFWTDIVAYKYGRGFKNAHEDAFHWTEKWSWRIAIYIPIYQNCTNGHWGPNAHRFSLLGRAHRYFVMVWGILFFIFQTLQADIPRTWEFMRGEKDQGGIISMLGLRKVPVLKKLRYPYFHGLVWMWSMYIVLHLLCFRMYRLSIRRAASSPLTPTDDLEEQKGLLSTNEENTDEQEASGVLMKSFDEEEDHTVQQGLLPATNRIDRQRLQF